MPDELTLFLVCRGCSNDAIISALTIQGENEMKGVAQKLTNPTIQAENTMIFTSPTRQEERSAQIIITECLLSPAITVKWLGEENIFPHLVHTMFRGGAKIRRKIKNVIVVTEKMTVQKILQIWGTPPLHIESGSLWKINLPDGKITRLI